MFNFLKTVKLPKIVNKYKLVNFMNCNKQMRSAVKMLKLTMSQNTASRRNMCAF
jgi:hypothetical protein